MIGRFDILNRAAVAGKAGTRKIPGSGNVGLAGLALDSAPRIKYGVTFLRGNDGDIRGNDGDGRGNDGKGQQAPVMRNPDLAEVSPEAAFVAAPEMALLMRSTFPDGPLEAARGEIAPEIRIHPRRDEKRRRTAHKGNNPAHQRDGEQPWLAPAAPRYPNPHKMNRIRSEK